MICTQVHALFIYTLLVRHHPSRWWHPLTSCGHSALRWVGPLQLTDLAGHPTPGNDEDFESIDDMENLIGVILNKLQSMGTDKQFNEWRNQLFSGMFDYTDRDEVLEWFDTIKQHYGPRMEGYQSCINQVPLYKGIPQNLPQYDVLTGCGWCSR